MNKFCSNLQQKTNPKFVWQAINKIKGKNLRSKYFLKDSNNSVISDSDLTEIFASNFQSLCSDKNFSPDIIKHRTDTIHTFLAKPGNVIKHNVTESADSKLLNEPFKKN